MVEVFLVLIYHHSIKFDCYHLNFLTVKKINQHLINYILKSLFYLCKFIDHKIKNYLLDLSLCYCIYPTS